MKEEKNENHPGEHHDDQDVVPDKTVTKRKSENGHFQKLFDQDMVLSLIPPIEDTLKKSILGKSIMETYVIKGILTNHQRDEIVDILIKDLSGRTDR